VLRAGLHHGEAVAGVGTYYDAAVNLAARVAARAGGGQVLGTAVDASIAPVCRMHVDRQQAPARLRFAGKERQLGRSWRLHPGRACDVRPGRGGCERRRRRAIRPAMQPSGGAVVRFEGSRSLGYRHTHADAPPGSGKTPCASELYVGLPQSNAARCVRAPAQISAVAKESAMRTGGPPCYTAWRRCYAEQSINC